MELMFIYFMLFVLSILIFVVSTPWFLMLTQGSFERKNFLLTTLHFMSFVLVFSSFIFILVNVLDSDDKREFLIDEIKLYNINDSQGISGGGNFMYIRVDTEGYYWYYYETDNGFKRDKIDSDGIYIVESEDNPRIETVKEFKVFGIFATMNTKTTIYVPKGSISNDYAFDNE